MSLSSLLNATFSLQVHAMASYLLKAIFSASKITSVEILKQSYTAANKSRHFLAIYGNLL